VSAMVLGIVVFASMLIETSISTRHDRELRARGAVEPAGDVYFPMQFAYPAAFLLMLGEGAWRGLSLDARLWTGAALFAAAKALKYWAIATLGVRWTFRVLVPPRSARIRTGPYRWLRHPNYVAVAGELVGVAVAAGALVTGPVATLGFIALMAARVRVEERALGLQRG